jgi:hypothetical protein
VSLAFLSQDCLPIRLIFGIFLSVAGKQREAYQNSKKVNKYRKTLKHLAEEGHEFRVPLSIDTQVIVAAFSLACMLSGCETAPFRNILLFSRMEISGHL